MIPEQEIIIKIHNSTWNKECNRSDCNEYKKSTPIEVLLFILNFSSLSKHHKNKPNQNKKKRSYPYRFCTGKASVRWCPSEWKVFREFSHPFSYWRWSRMHGRVPDVAPRATMIVTRPGVATPGKTATVVPATCFGWKTDPSPVLALLVVSSQMRVLGRFWSLIPTISFLTTILYSIL